MSIHYFTARRNNCCVTLITHGAMLFCFLLPLIVRSTQRPKLLLTGTSSSQRSGHCNTREGSALATSSWMCSWVYLQSLLQQFHFSDMNNKPLSLKDIEQAIERKDNSLFCICALQERGPYWRSRGTLFLFLSLFRGKSLGGNISRRHRDARKGAQVVFGVQEFCQ